MGAATGIGIDAARAYGLSAFAGANVAGRLVYERPVWIHQPGRLKDCTMGAFSYINSRGSCSLYRCHIGRFAQIGEQVLVGPPDHPSDWFSSHPFAFTQPGLMPHMDRMPEFARLAPEDGRLSQRYIAGVATETVIGHEVYMGSKAYVRRGVTIGHGAIIGTASVVLDDVPPYAIVVGSPARVLRLRFDERIVERLLALQWWHYDLAPHKHAVDFSQVEATLEFFEQRKADGELEPLTPETYTARCDDDVYTIEQQRQPLYTMPDNADYPAVGAPPAPRPRAAG